MPASSSRALAVPAPQGPHTLADAIVDLVARVPPSGHQASAQPDAQALAVARAAARQASLVAGSMSLPPGFFGWLTLLPELLAVWRLQAQMVADIAALYGKTPGLTREQMLYCLFKHLGAQLFRDVAVRTGERLVFQQATLSALQSLAHKLGIKISQGLVAQGASRFVPLLGALGVGTYAYFDTQRVARTAMQLFTQELTVDAG
jgi:hypothetical protein